MGKSKIEISDEVLEQLIAFQHYVEFISTDDLRQWFRELLVDIKQADDMERYRVCCACSVITQQGYVIDGCDVYCSETCLHQRISAEEYDELYRDGEADSYWTEW